jgi:hypothetical protein
MQQQQNAVNRRRPQNHGSALLSPNENEQLFAILGKACFVSFEKIRINLSKFLATAVVGRCYRAIVVRGAASGRVVFAVHRRRCARKGLHASRILLPIVRFATPHNALGTTIVSGGAGGLEVAFAFVLQIRRIPTAPSVQHLVDI